MIARLSNNIKLSYNNNDISFRHKSQQRKVTDVAPSNEQLLDNPVIYLNENLTKAEKAVLNHYLALSNTFQDIYFAQSTIGKKTGYSRKSINKILKRLRELGLLDYNYKHMNTCDYKVSSWFNNKEIRDKLKVLFSSLHYLPLIWIIASQASTQHLFSQYKYIYKENISYKENRHEIFEFNNFHKINFEQKRENLDMSAFEQAIDSVLNESHNTPKHISSLQPILKLTDYGTRYLECFPLEALQFAATRTLVKRELTGNPWSYFNKLLQIYCQERNFEPDTSHLPVQQPYTSGLVLLDKLALKKWLASSSSFLKEGKQADRQSQALCCASCTLNKTQGPLKSTGADRLCDKERKANASLPGFNSAGEPYAQAREKIYKEWSDANGVLRFVSTIKLIGWDETRTFLNQILPPEDQLPAEQPSNLVEFTRSRISSPF